MNKQDFEKDYDNYTRDLDSEDIKTPVSESRQTFRKKKKIILAAASIVLAGAVAASIFGLKGCSKDGMVDTPSESTSIDDGEDLSEYEYVLVENFNVNDDNQVAAVVNDINEIGNFDFNVKNLIYLYNGVLQRSDFSQDMSDLEIFNELQDYLLKINDIYSLGVNEYADAISKLEDGEQSEINYDEKIIGPRAIVSTDSKSTDYSTRLSSNLNSLLKDVQNGVTTNFDKYSSEYYKIFTEVMNDDTLEPGEKAAILNFVKAVAPLYSRLTKEQRDEIDKEVQALLENTLVFEMLNKLGSDFASIVAYYDDGNMGKPLTPLTERYNSSDSADANANAGKTGEEDVTEKVKTGGQKVSGSGSHETVSEATTSRLVVSTTIVNVPDKETTTKKVTGGDPVGPTETQTETTTKLDEEVVPPGTEPSVEDVRPTDDDGIPIYSEDEWEKEQGKSSNSMALGAGVATLAVLSGAAGSLKVLRDRNNYKDSDSLTNAKGTSKKKKRK